MSDEAEQGVCDLCGQEMIRTADDCWHPWHVAKACPTEVFVNGMWRATHGRTLRPGREHFRLSADGGTPQ